MYAHKKLLLAMKNSIYAKVKINPSSLFPFFKISFFNHTGVPQQFCLSLQGNNGQILNKKY